VGILGLLDVDMANPVDGIREAGTELPKGLDLDPAFAQVVFVSFLDGDILAYYRPC